MIVVDTSALMAIFLTEEDSESLAGALFTADPALIAAPTAFEFLMVAEGRRRGERPRILIDRPGIRIVPWEEEHLLMAQRAFLTYGKGRGHPARLNFGDCMSYALAKSLEAPLLYKGGDFALTDIRAALAA